VKRTRIKFCGITSPDDARAAAAAGADAIGLVFHEPSPRNVSLEQAAEIIGALPPFISTVGLFVDAPLERVRATVSQLRLHLVQLHGRETPEMVARLSLANVMKVIHVEPGRLVADLQTWRESLDRLELAHLRALLLETGNAPAVGGTGVANDWDQIRAAGDAGAFDRLPPIVLAGGLTPETVAEVVRTIRPFAVDVSSGIEISPGRKSAERMQAFASAVRAADAASDRS
jgi:phosphoribosylanthranilate isomerase